MKKLVNKCADRKTLNDYKYQIKNLKSNVNNLPMNEKTINDYIRKIEHILKELFKLKRNAKGNEAEEIEALIKTADKTIKFMSSIHFNTNVSHTRKNHP